MNASDIMTSPVITVGPDTTVGEIARLLFERRISAVPVMEEGRLVGLVAARDRHRSRRTARLLVAASVQPGSVAGRIHQVARAASSTFRWWARGGWPASSAGRTNVIVADGVVHLWGTLESEDERRAARVVAENIPGVRGIEDHRFRLDSLPVAP